MNLPFFIARRYLQKQKGTFSSFIIRLSIVATALSVAVMILSVAFITGFRQTIREKLYSFMGHVHIELHDPNHAESLSLSPIKKDAELEKNIRGIPHVTGVFPFMMRPTIVQFHGQMEGVFLKGVDKEHRHNKSVTFTGKPIDYSDTAYSKQIILSKKTADRLNLKSGDTAQLYFLDPQASFPKIRKVVISGLYHTGVDDVDRIYGLCDMRLLQRVNNLAKDEINAYQIDLDDEQYADQISNLVYEKYVQPPLTTYTMREIYPQIFDWLGIFDTNISILLIIMAIVAIINMASGVLILMVDRANMIGLLKALGLSYSSTRNIFLSIGGLIGITGVVLGNVLALGICFLQQATGFIKLPEETYYMSEASVSIPWQQVVLIDLATLLLCILCVWLPALYIRRIQPARVLQFK